MFAPYIGLELSLEHGRNSLIEGWLVWANTPHPLSLEEWVCAAQALE